MSLLVLSFLVLIASFCLTGIVKLIAERYRFIDAPVARSAHTQPVPVGGGISIVILLELVACYYYIQGDLPLSLFMALLGGCPIAVAGLADDKFKLGIKWRLSVQVFAVVWALWWLGGIPLVQLGHWQLQINWLLGLLTGLALLWLINLYNFMDGIDGLAGSEVCCVALVVILLSGNGDDSGIALLSTTLFAACAGFLLWNWSPAKIFMGDVGSGFLGYTLGVLAIISIQQGSFNVWSWLLLSGIFIVDASVTLIQRFSAGDEWYQGHSTHAYQKAARQFKSHSIVTITVIAINFLWLTPLVWLSIEQPENAFYWAVAGLLPIVLLVVKLKAGKPDRIEPTSIAGEAHKPSGY